MKKLLIAIGMICLLQCGCTSMTTMVLNRQDADYFCKNSKLPSKGIPITLKVPTHLKVSITEEHYLTTVDQAGAKTLAPVSLPNNRRVLSVTTAYDYTEKLFTVDFKRPGAGTIMTDIELDPESQYFKQIHSKVVDNTIREITSIVGQFQGPLGLRTSNTGSKIAEHLITDHRVVAFQRFDINAPDFEQQLAFFLDHHLNQCHNCAGWQCPTLDEIIKRSPIVDPSAAPTPATPTAIYEDENIRIQG